MKRTWKKNSSALDKSRISFSEGYLFFESRIKNEFNINADSFDFTKVSKREKTGKIINYLKKHHDPKLNDRGYSYFFSFYPFSYAMVIFVRNNIFIVYPHQTQRIFVPKYYHDRRRTNFLKNLRFVGEKPELDERYFQENQILGRKLYEYVQSNNSMFNLTGENLDFYFPDKWYNSIGYTINGFSFKIEKAPTELKTILDPKDNLINLESGIEEINLPDEEKFLTKTEREIANKLSEYRAIPTKNFINESYFLYDKSNLIKKTYITAFNKQIALYGSFSYFSGKTTAKNLTLLSTNNFLKFFIEKKLLKQI